MIEDEIFEWAYNQKTNNSIAKHLLAFLCAECILNKEKKFLISHDYLCAQIETTLNKIKTGLDLLSELNFIKYFDIFQHSYFLIEINLPSKFDKLFGVNK